MNFNCVPKEAAALLNNASDLKIENDYLLWYRYINHNARDKNDKNTQFSIKLSAGTINELNKRTNRIMRTLPYSQEFTFRQQSRWAIGIGGTSPYGNLLLLTLHPLYGVPYIPASTLKGLTRLCWIDTNCEGNEQDEEVLRLFGAPADEAPTNERAESEQNGKLVFFDSFPSASGIGKLVKDVFAPHYPDYYKDFEKNPPTDDQNPVPIEFLCLDGFTFTVHIGAQTPLSADEEKKLKKAVNKVFSEHGIGAKTALGYGYGTECC